MSGDPGAPRCIEIRILIGVDERGWAFARVDESRVTPEGPDASGASERVPAQDSDPAVADAPPVPGAEGSFAEAGESSAEESGADVGEGSPAASLPTPAPRRMRRDRKRSEIPAEQQESSPELGAQAPAEGSGAVVEEGLRSAPLPIAAPRGMGSSTMDPEPDWPTLVARVFAGEREKDVAASAGVKPGSLRGKVMAERWSQKRSAAKAGVSDAPVVSKAKPVRAHKPAGEWLPAEDITVLRGIGQGRSSFAVSQKLKGRSADEVAARFAVLVPRASAMAVEEALRGAMARHTAARGTVK